MRVDGATACLTARDHRVAYHWLLFPRIHAAPLAVMDGSGQENPRFVASCLGRGCPQVQPPGRRPHAWRPAKQFGCFRGQNWGCRLPRLPPDALPRVVGRGRGPSTSVVRTTRGERVHGCLPAQACCRLPNGWQQETTDNPMRTVGCFGVQGLFTSRASGVVLILSGLALAAYAMPSGAGSGALGPALKGYIGDHAAADRRPSRDETAATRQAAAVVIDPPPAARAEPAPAFSTPIVVTIAPRPSEAPAAAARRTASVPSDRDGLARELQKELRRVGCYEGEVNGVWTPSTRRAMKAFTERVNAILPVAEPDAVLLVMVQSQQDRTCGRPCPANQGLTEDGRCLPSAILAKAMKKALPAGTVAHAGASEPAPIVNPVPPASRAPAIAGWSATVTAATPAPEPSLPVVGAAREAASVPTEGRMGLAGPRDESTPLAHSDVPAVAKPRVRTRAAARAKSARSGPRIVSAPRREAYVRTFFRRVEAAN